MTAKRTTSKAKATGVTVNSLRRLESRSKPLALSGGKDRAGKALTQENSDHRATKGVIDKPTARNGKHIPDRQVTSNRCTRPTSVIPSEIPRHEVPKRAERSRNKELSESSQQTYARSSATIEVERSQTPEVAPRRFRTTHVSLVAQNEMFLKELERYRVSGGD